MTTLAAVDPGRGRAVSQLPLAGGPISAARPIKRRLHDHGPRAAGRTR